MTPYPPPAAINGSGMPKAIVSLAPAAVVIPFGRGSGKTVQAPPVIFGTVIVMVADWHCVIGVPPLPMVTDPLAATSPLLSTLNLVTPLLCPRRIFPALLGTP